ncbi:hypothetical protein D083_2695 [Dickeya solani RNS 08.23.3.1.A]|nr:hypothetical protein D083_2695 [Dickeya solani RNS 08.23.3.1.A]
MEKTTLLNSPIITDKKKSYLITGDRFKLLDMSDNGLFYKIRYEIKSGKALIAWVTADDFSLDEK